MAKSQIKKYPNQQKPEHRNLEGQNIEKPLQFKRVWEDI
jgi:hypothetical protein